MVVRLEHPLRNPVLILITFDKGLRSIVESFSQLVKKNPSTPDARERGLRSIEVSEVHSLRKEKGTVCGTQPTNWPMSIVVRPVHLLRKAASTSTTPDRGRKSIEVRPVHLTRKSICIFVTCDRGLRSTVFRPLHP